MGESVSESTRPHLLEAALEVRVSAESGAGHRHHAASEQQAPTGQHGEVSEDGALLVEGPVHVQLNLREESTQHGEVSEDGALLVEGPVHVHGATPRTRVTGEGEGLWQHKKEPLQQACE